MLSSTEQLKEKAIMVGVQIKREARQDLTLDASLQELELLAETAGIEVVGSVIQNLDNPNSRTYIGKGKLEELILLAEELNAKTILFDDELSPATKEN